MDHRRPVITSNEDIQALRRSTLAAADVAHRWACNLSDEPLAFLRAAKFDKVGCDPLSGKPLNLVEQINQTFTILVALRAVEQLLDMHPTVGGFRLALATASGRDIESVAPNMVAAEVFAATTPDSNRKLDKELAKLAREMVAHRYVFFAAPGFMPGRQSKLERVPGIEVHSVTI
jgi:hypothetical protein